MTAGPSARRGGGPARHAAASPRHVALLAAVAALMLAPDAADAQRRNIDQLLRDNRDRLQQIRLERDSLEAARTTLQRRARSVMSELQNLNQQRHATSRLVNELDRQISGLSSQLDTITMELILAEDASAEKQAVLERRVAEIYKRGPLWMFQVLMAAESFGDLVSRYKYLYLVSRQDRRMVEEVRMLRDLIAGQRGDLLNVRTEVESQRRERDTELQEFASLERQHQRVLTTLRRSEQLTESQLQTLSTEAEALTSAIAQLERTRRAAVASGAATAPTITDADLGSLEWPVDDGRIVYRHGRQEFRDGTAIRHEGIGIGVPVGTPVRAVRGGTVRSVAPFGTYGPQVWLDHGGGFYTLYLYLSRVTVRRGQVVNEGDVVGLSGGENSREGPHIEFQLRRTPPNAEIPVAMDPLNWLKRR